MDHPFLIGLSDALVHAGVAVMRFAFPYREAGRRMPGPAGHAIATWRAVLPTLAELVPDVAYFAAGKSYGGRMASMATAESVIAPHGLIYLGYPLHAPGKPEKPRAEHLPAIGVPQLFVEGRNDPFIQPREQFEAIVDSCQDAQVHWIDGGGHSFEVRGKKRPADQIGAELAPILIDWMRATL